MKRKTKNNLDELKLLASFFQHKSGNQLMTYIFIIDSDNEIKRAKVPLKNGLPQIKKGLKWEHFSHI